MKRKPKPAARRKPAPKAKPQGRNGVLVQLYLPKELLAKIDAVVEGLGALTNRSRWCIAALEKAIVDPAQRSPKSTMTHVIDLAGVASYDPEHPPKITFPTKCGACGGMNGKHEMGCESAGTAVA